MRRLHPRIATFVHAGRGLIVLAGQPNARIHFFAALVVILLGVLLDVTAGEWVALSLAIALVLAAEALNTALELVVDLASPEWSETARNAKDVAAAGVLICAIGAAVVGAIIFVPRLI